MAIKRLTIEMDDLTDTLAGTSSPTSLTGKNQRVTGEREPTNPPEKRADYQQPETAPQAQDILATNEPIGRTPSDLVFAFINRPEFMATGITLVAMVIFVTKINNIDDFWRPLLTAGILNFIWFGITTVRVLVKWFKQK